MKTNEKYKQVDERKMVVHKVRDTKEITTGRDTKVTYLIICLSVVYPLSKSVKSPWNSFVLPTIHTSEREELVLL